jgi:hypothetical protein
VEDLAAKKQRLVEIKCPFAAKYSFVPPEVLAQVQMELAVYNLTECDLLLYHSDELLVHPSFKLCKADTPSLNRFFVSSDRHNTGAG